jgi:DNA-binding NarL/FixJ family response regulator
MRRKRNKHNNSPYVILTNREREVLKLIAEGRNNKGVARLLCISPRTVEHHRMSIMRKVGVSNIANLVRYAIKAGFSDLN